MGKGLVLYRSKYGASKKYAQMTAEEFGADLSDISLWKGNPADYGWAVFCGAVYAGGISGIGTLKNIMEEWGICRWRFFVWERRPATGRREIIWNRSFRGFGIFRKS